MAMLCALDWRHYGVIATLTPDAAGGARLVLTHGPDELVVHLSWQSLDALTYAGLLQCWRAEDAAMGRPRPSDR
jgi:hypothetical protein